MRKHCWLVFLCIVGVVSLADVARSQCDVTEDETLPLCDPSANQTGNALATEGSWASVGVKFDGEHANQAGAVWVYHHNGASWNCDEKLIHPSPSVQDRFGWSVDMSGEELIIVGAPFDDVAGGIVNAGSACIFRRHALAGWEFECFLEAPIPATEAQFGYSVSIDGNIAVVGANKEDCGPMDAGAAYVFEYQGNCWQFVQELCISPSNNDEFGTSVSVKGDRILVGAPWNDTQGTNSGSATMYLYNGGTNQWDEEQTLFASFNDDSAFGWSVTLAESVAVVGAPFRDLGPQTLDSGAAYVFHLDESAPAGQRWSEVQELLAHDPEAGDRFGWENDIDGDTIVIGSKSNLASEVGAAYQFQLIADTWLEERKLSPSDGVDGDEFGSAVAVYGDLVLVGAPEANGSTGGVYAYEVSGLHLSTNSDCVVAGDTLEFVAQCGNEGALCHLVIVQPFLHVFSQAFGPDHRFQVDFVIPPGLPVPFDLTFQCYGEDPVDGLIASNQTDVSFK